MKKILNYIFIPFFLSLLLTTIALIFLVTIYYPERLGKYEITGYCVLIYIIGHGVVMTYHWLFIEGPEMRNKLHQLQQYNLGQQKTQQLIEYIQQYNLTKIYVSRELYNVFFHDLRVTRVAPNFYYFENYSRICVLKIDPYLAGFKFNTSNMKNWITNINDLYY